MKSFFKRTKAKAKGVESPIEPTAAESAPSSVNQYPVGIEVLKDPSSPVVDIVFVHGLTGNRDRTWTGPGSSQPWPAILLPEDVQGARISTYGYDADIVSFWGASSRNRIRDHARNLLSDLTDLRENSETTNLPIIFVAHSLGGLVCENALIISNNAEKHLRRLLECTRAIAFLGTPHCGS